MFKCGARVPELGPTLLGCVVCLFTLLENVVDGRVPTVPSTISRKNSSFLLSVSAWLGRDYIVPSDIGGTPVLQRPAGEE